jgi:hypothetical protein
MNDPGFASSQLDFKQLVDDKLKREFKRKAVPARNNEAQNRKPRNPRHHARRGERNLR